MRTNFALTIYLFFLYSRILDDVVKSQKTPSPLKGEGRGEGGKGSYFSRLIIPLPFVPSREGRGDSNSYEIFILGYLRIFP